MKIKTTKDFHIWKGFISLLELKANKKRYPNGYYSMLVWYGFLEKASDVADMENDIWSAAIDALGDESYCIAANITQGSKEMEDALIQRLDEKFASRLERLFPLAEVRSSRDYQSLLLWAQTKEVNVENIYFIFCHFGDRSFTQKNAAVFNLEKHMMNYLRDGDEYQKTQWY